jgi:hypothetical protein
VDLLRERGREELFSMEWRKECDERRRTSVVGCGLLPSFSFFKKNLLILFFLSFIKV